jgi:hypothetical protein
MDEGNTSWRSVKDPRAIRSCKEARRLRRVPFRSAIISGEIVAIGSNSTRVVGSHANSHFGNSGIGVAKDRGVAALQTPSS